ncbi:hypothetical protein FF1_041344 [Malus domestica]
MVVRWWCDWCHGWVEPRRAGGGGGGRQTKRKAWSLEDGETEASMVKIRRRRRVKIWCPQQFWAQDRSPISTGPGPGLLQSEKMMRCSNGSNSMVSHASQPPVHFVADVTHSTPNGDARKACKNLLSLGTTQQAKAQDFPYHIGCSCKHATNPSLQQYH